MTKHDNKIRWTYKHRPPITTEKGPTKEKKLDRHLTEEYIATLK